MRADARQGDLFTPSLAHVLRRHSGDRDSGVFPWPAGARAYGVAAAIIRAAKPKGGRILLVSAAPLSDPSNPERLLIGSVAQGALTEAPCLP